MISVGTCLHGAYSDWKKVMLSKFFLIFFLYTFEVRTNHNSKNVNKSNRKNFTGRVFLILANKGRIHSIQSIQSIQNSDRKKGKKCRANF